MTVDHNEPLLRLADVSMTYPDPGGAEPRRVLDGVHLAVSAGAFFTVAGRSGSGKTTLLQIAAGMLTGTGGHVTWSGTDVATLGGKERARRRASHIGIVFQESELVATLTAAENVALSSFTRASAMHGRRHRREARDRVGDLLDGLGLAGRASHLPGQMSGGERQRVALARALFADPGLLIVDEPTASLDRARADAVIETLRKVAADGTGVLVASHDPHVLAGATQALVLEDV